VPGRWWCTVLITAAGHERAGRGPGIFRSRAEYDPALWYADISLQGLNFADIFIQFTVLVMSLSIHEAAHAWSADRLGDPTARLLGRVSVNPAVHVDPIGTILFPLIAMIARVPLIGWAKPVPVGIQYLRGNWRQKFMLIAAAGPISNLLIATVAAVVLRVISGGSPFEVTQGLAGRILLFVIELNVLLALFNLVPVPPLDGGNVLAGLLSGPAAAAFDRLRPYGFLIIYALLLTGILWSVIAPFERAILSVLL
jgi:Zn-dependent protease